MERKTKKRSKPFSVHLIADLEAPKFIENAGRLKKILWEAALAANNTPLKVSVHKFPEQGITGVVLLAESHIAIHTWPECSYAAVDIFTCGRRTKPYQALEYLKKVFGCSRVKTMFIRRGKI